MATSDKPKKIKFEFDPWKECRGKDVDAKKWAEGQVNVIKAIKFDLTPSKALDERKWPEKKVLEEAYYGGPKMAVIMFTQQIVQLKDDKKKDDKAKAKELKSMYDNLCKDMEDAVEKWLEEVASGKADNAKGLKDGKAAMGKITDVEFKGAFDKPQKACVEALKGVLKGGKVDEKELAKAKKTLEGVKAEMEKTAQDAQDSIAFLMKSAKNSTKDKDADKSLQDFGKEVLTHEKEFDAFLEGAEEFDTALEDGLKAAEDGMDEKKLGDLIKEFEKLSGLEKKAQDCMKIAKELAPKFKKIADKLK